MITLQLAIKNAARPVIMLLHFSIKNVASVVVICDPESFATLTAGSSMKL